MDRMTNNSKEEKRVSRGAAIAMIVIVLGLALVSLYANWQNAHRQRIEKTSVTRLVSPLSPPPAGAP